MQIPFFELNRQNSEIQADIMDKISAIFAKGDFINGGFVKEFEQKVGEYLGVKNVITCGNGTDALSIALMAVGVKPGDEVITTPFSFFATAEAIASVGAVPVFVDIDEDTLNIDPDCIEEKITDKTQAILLVHIFGRAAEMDKINAIAKKHNIKVVEDACQAIGAEYKGTKVGGLGDIACFSFYPTKNLGACGDGGMITTNDDDLAVISRAIKSHGSGKIGAQAKSLLTNEKMEDVKVNQEATALYDPFKYYNYIIGVNSRLDTMQAAVLLTKLEHLDTYSANRKKHAKRYYDELKGLPMKVLEHDEECCYHQYAVLVDEKDAFVKHLNDKGIGTGAFYPVPLHLQKAFDELGYKEGSLPVAESVCNRSVCLPIFPELTDEEMSYIIDTIKEFFEK